MNRLVGPCWLLLLAVALSGCGGSDSPPPRASTEQHITVEEWKKLPPEERQDPYVLQRLRNGKTTMRKP